MNPEILATISHELTELEKKPINGWDAVYPTLFNFLNDNLKELCASTTLSTMPGIVVRFDKIQTWQASAMVMTDGSMQMHIGAEFIRNFVLNTDEANLAPGYEQFKWVIAHELGHLCDPAFISYCKAFTLRSIINQSLSIIFYAGLIGFFWPRWADFLGVNPMLLMGISTALSIIQYIATIIIFRKFEYNADKISMTIHHTCSPEQAGQAIEMIRTPIVAFASTCNPLEPKTILESYFPMIANFSLYKKYLLYSYFHLHPSIKSRVIRLKQIGK